MSTSPQRGEEEEERRPLLGGGAEGGMLARWAAPASSICQLLESFRELLVIFPIYCVPRYVEGSTLYEGSVRNFYSPFESPEASDDEEEVGVLKFRRKKHKHKYHKFLTNG